MRGICYITLHRVLFCTYVGCTPVSDKIKELIESTKSWLKTEVATDNDEAQPPSIEEVEFDAIAF